MRRRRRRRRRRGRRRRRAARQILGRSRRKSTEAPIQRKDKNS